MVSVMKTVLERVIFEKCQTTQRVPLNSVRSKKKKNSSTEIDFQNFSGSTQNRIGGILTAQ